MKVLIVEDDPNIMDVIVTAFDLGWPEATVFKAITGSKGVELVETKSPDAVILDLGLPDISGFDVIGQIRMFSEVPILVLTVRNEESSIVKALSLGADDYQTKPFRQMELLARIKALTRRSNVSENASGIQIGDWRLSNSLTELSHCNNIIRLTSTEGLLLSILMKNESQFVKHESLSRQVWNRHHAEVADALRVYIGHLREKIEDNPKSPKNIINKPRHGYMFVAS